MLALFLYHLQIIGSEVCCIFCISLANMGSASLHKYFSSIKCMLDRVLVSGDSTSTSGSNINYQRVLSKINYVTNHVTGASKHTNKYHQNLHESVKVEGCICGLDYNIFQLEGRKIQRQIIQRPGVQCYLCVIYKCCRHSEEDD